MNSNLVVSSGYTADVFIPESPFHGLNGLRFFRDQLYAVDLFGDFIHVDRQSGNWSVILDASLAPADDMVFQNSGVVFVTALLPGEVRKFTPTGFTNDIPTYSPNYEVIASHQPQVDPLAIHTSGRFFFGSFPSTGALYEVLLNDGNKEVQILNNTNGLNAFEFGKHPDDQDWLYSPQGNTGKVIRIQIDTGVTQTVATGFTYPIAVKINATGNYLFGVDVYTGLVFRVTLANGDKEIIARLEPGLDNLAVDDQDRVYVSNFVEKGIYEVLPGTGQVRTILEGAPSQGGKLTTPGGLGFYEEQGRSVLYVADLYAYRTLDANTGAQISLTRVLASPQTSAMSLSLNKQHVIITGWILQQVQILDRITGAYLATLNGFSNPYDAIELSDGSLLVADSGTGSIIHIPNPHGTDPWRVALNGLHCPMGLVADATETYFYFTDTEAGTLSRAKIGEVNGKAEVLVSNLSLPQGIAWDTQQRDRLYLAESGRRQLLAINITTRTQTTIASNLPINLPPYNMEMGGPVKDVVYIPTGIAVATSGKIYISANETNAIYTITPQS